MAIRDLLGIAVMSDKIHFRLLSADLCEIS